MEAGHHSQIVDYGPGQSLVKCALDHFDGDVYVIDKLPAGPEHSDYSIEDSIRSVDKCIQYIGEPCILQDFARAACERLHSGDT